MTLNSDSSPARAATKARRPTASRSVELRLTKPWLIVLAVTLGLAGLGALAGGARALFGYQDSAQVREQLAAIHGELIQIRLLMESEPEGEDVEALRATSVSVSGQPSLGSPNAPVTLVEFTDFQCPFCSRFHAQTFPLIRKAFVEPGRVRYVSLDFPLTSIHPDALRAARASHCGEEQGRYWETHDTLFNQRGRLGRAAILEAIQGMGLNTQKFALCLDTEANDGRIRQSLTHGRALGINGTPTFLLGRSQGSAVAGRMIVGAQPFEVFDDLIRDLLEKR
jgi:protein-disulfide isomerase